MKYVKRNKDSEQQTATPSKYPQGKFYDKECRWCLSLFSPNSPRNHYCTNECKNSGLQDLYLRRTYGIGVRDYELMLNSQDNKCKICESEGFTMRETHTMKLVIDHCHVTGKVRGLLCHNCNRALGLLHDNKQHLLNAIEYLKV